MERCLWLGTLSMWHVKKRFVNNEQNLREWFRMNHKSVLPLFARLRAFLAFWKECAGLVPSLLMEKCCPCGLLIGRTPSCSTPQSACFQFWRMNIGGFLRSAAGSSLA